MKPITHSSAMAALLLMTSCSLLGGEQDADGRPDSAPQNNTQEAAIDRASLNIERQDALKDGQVQLLACAQDGRWASASPHGVRVYDAEGQKLHDARTRHLSAGGLDFTPRSDTLFLGVGVFSPSKGQYEAQTPIPDLAAWAKAQGVDAPQTLNVQAARYSADGGSLIVYANTTSRSRRGGQRRATGDPDWLFLLNGRDRTPKRILAHGKGRVTHIAADQTLAIAGGRGVQLHDLGGDRAPTTLAPDHTVTALALSDDFLAVTTHSHLLVWRRGQWQSPAVEIPVGDDVGSALAFHPRRAMLATGSRDQKVRLYAIERLLKDQPQPLDTVDIGGIVNALSFTADGRSLRAAVGAPGQGVALINLALP